MYIYIYIYAYVYICIYKYIYIHHFAGCAFNGWFLLTSQMHFVEAQHFHTWQRIQFACIKQGNFWMSVVVLLCVLLVLLVLLDEGVCMFVRIRVILVALMACRFL